MSLLLAFLLDHVHYLPMKLVPRVVDLHLHKPFLFDDLRYLVGLFLLMRLKW